MDQGLLWIKFLEKMLNTFEEILSFINIKLLKFRDKSLGSGPRVDTVARDALVNLSTLEEEDCHLPQVEVDEMPEKIFQ